MHPRYTLHDERAATSRHHTLPLSALPSLPGASCALACGSLFSMSQITAACTVLALFSASSTHASLATTPISVRFSRTCCCRVSRGNRSGDDVCGPAGAGSRKGRWPQNRASTRAAVGDGRGMGQWEERDRGNSWEEHDRARKSSCGWSLQSSRSQGVTPFFRKSF